VNTGHFDRLTHSMWRHASRRAAFGLLGGGLAALLNRAGSMEIEARKKKHKSKKKTRKNKRRKQCPAGGKPCGTSCVPSTSCCTNADCGSENHSCDDGLCICAAPSDVPCSTPCCRDEVCASIYLGEEEIEVSCQAGGCPATDWCSDDNLYACGDACSCATSISDATVCTDWRGGVCHTCASDDECTTALGRAAMCISNGAYCHEICDPTFFSKFCIAAGCPSGGALPRASVTTDAPARKRKLLR
jgi:hypothetical protein